jgi:hypothetical protein
LEADTNGQLGAFTGVNDAGNVKPSVIANYQPANDASAHRSTAIMQAGESQGFQLVTANSWRKRSVSVFVFSYSSFS